MRVFLGFGGFQYDIFSVFRSTLLANLLILGLLRKPDVAVGIRLDSVRLITNISKPVSTTGATTWREFAAA
jgi:hypothetical protein